MARPKEGILTVLGEAISDITGEPLIPAESAAGAD
jgi:hypothetical protein